MLPLCVDTLEALLELFTKFKAFQANGFEPMLPSVFAGSHRLDNLEPSCCLGFQLS
jgi:hypothetical protein